VFAGSRSIAPFVASPMSVVRKMLEYAEVKPGETVYDLGCGDGRIVIMAAQEFGARGVGVDLNPRLVKETRAKVEALGLGGRVRIINGDLFDVDVSQLRPGARVVTHDFSIEKWGPVRNLKFRENYRSHTIYLYKWGQG